MWAFGITWCPSFVVCHLLTFHILIFSSETHQPNELRNKNCLWWPCLLTDRDEMSNLHKEHSMDASCQVSVNLAKQFQRRRLKYEKVNEQTADAK
jgi:hypothetical protein